MQQQLSLLPGSRLRCGEWRPHQYVSYQEKAGAGVILEVGAVEKVLRAWLGYLGCCSTLHLAKQTNFCRFEDALQLYRTTLQLRQKVLGDEHAHTSSSVKRLACCLELKGEHNQAEPLFVQALEARKRMLGPHHPHSLVSTNNLADCLSKQSNHKGALPFYKAVLEGRENVLGSDHPRTVQSKGDMASCMERLGLSVLKI
ncbi:hypothetical protein DUNSADRAFT_10082 [Dunaliella salina]|uniref:Kinesin light chain n=1 Tax=Dunaliella salina TaxID=3046 RepID=A0ABQ7GG22_DUNSA|nr:hypothetical protein DUNSADRAFT_10082 [Dunaliella salina]|eukprot:KAF5833550.1 hypothetical protein DUNSADRAFT_10082 [Dunaliella salina]